MEFGIPGYDDLVWDVSHISDRISISTQNGLNGKLQLGDYLNARARIKNNRYRRDYTAKNVAFAPAILSVTGKFHPEFLRLLWVLADMQTVKYFNLVGDEEDIRNERFKWSWVTFSYTSNSNRNAIGLAVAYASAAIGAHFKTPTARRSKSICPFLSPTTSSRPSGWRPCCRSTPWK